MCLVVTLQRAKFLHIMKGDFAFGVVGKNEG
jgi:hypothetical protein